MMNFDGFFKFQEIQNSKNTDEKITEISTESQNNLTKNVSNLVAKVFGSDQEEEVYS